MFPLGRDTLLWNTAQPPQARSSQGRFTAFRSSHSFVCTSCPVRPAVAQGSSSGSCTALGASLKSPVGAVPGLSLICMALVALQRPVERPCVGVSWRLASGWTSWVGASQEQRSLLIASYPAARDSGLSHFGHADLDNFMKVMSARCLNYIADRLSFVISFLVFLGGAVNLM